MLNVKFFADTIDPKAYNQVMTLASQSAFEGCKIRIMPDVHPGAGCVIGFTADLGEKVIPNIVGVDIGCGMLTVELGQIDIDFEKLDDVIHTYVPSGRNVHSAVACPSKFLKQLYCYDHLKNIRWLRCSLGTLGGGNHFIEIDVAADGTKAIAMFKLPGGAVVAHGSQQPERSSSKIFSRGNGAEDTRERKGTKERAR